MLFFLCAFAAALPTVPPSVIRVDQEYTHDAPRSSWYTINLAHPTAMIKSIMWCKSITPNMKHPPPLNDCKGAGLTHLELYPGRVRVLPEEPNTVYIDPEQIGGWDTEHQFAIIVHAKVKEREAELMQVVRFNALPHTPQAGGAVVEHVVSPPILNGGGAEHVPPNGGGINEAHSSSTAATSAAAEQQQQQQQVHPWLATGIVFAVGMFIFVVLGSLMALKKSEKFRNAAAYKQQTDYEFNKLPSFKGEEEDIELQDLSILMKLGKGANEAFKMNLD